LGYFNGDPQQILNAPVDIVQSLLDYEKFEQDFDDEFKALNKPKT
jgi:hypothetical protein